MTQVQFAVQETRKSHFYSIITLDTNSHKFELQTKQKRIKTKKKRLQSCIFQTGYSTLSSLFAQLQLSLSIPSKPRKYEGDFEEDELNGLGSSHHVLVTRKSSSR
mmetsp:Transcript_13633/g.28149  ORF Transcript_13633/g.28149 Transcript_13633/m.28149 type:complete len:105 (+) Transcript_13633:749-1063(+)